MKRLYSLISLLLLCLPSFSQSNVDYNPANPEEQDLLYHLKLEASPSTGGHFVSWENNYGTSVTFYSEAESDLPVDKEVNIKASANSGYAFTHWTIGDSVVSPSEEVLVFTMPRHDVTITAHFVQIPYNPENPAEPQPIHCVKIIKEPSTGGECGISPYYRYQANDSIYYLAEGDTATLFASPKTSYQFEAWQLNGARVAEYEKIKIRMGKEDLAYTALFTYSPQSPYEPVPGGFDPTTGVLMIDGENPNVTCDDIVGEENYELVKSIIIKGPYNECDYAQFPNCITFDLSCRTGLNSLPSGAFSGLYFKKIYLPHTIKEISWGTLQNCPNLTEIYLYATVPPKLWWEPSADPYDDTKPLALSYLNPNTTIYVPSASLALYRAAEGWKELNTMPMDGNGNGNKITVRIAQQAVSETSNMRLELFNSTLGQTMRYLVDGRTEYTFFDLRNSVYNVYLKNSKGTVLAEMTDLEVKDADLDVEISDIKPLYYVSLKVLSESGENISEKSSVIWYDDHGNYICRSNTVHDLVENDSLQYDILLNDELAVIASQPDRCGYRVRQKNDTIVVNLKNIETIRLGGRVVNSKHLTGVAGATLTISQIVNGKHFKNSVVNTDERGYYSADVLRVPAQISVSALDYFDKKKDIDFEPDIKELILDDIVLKSGINAIIDVNMSYTPSFVEGEEAEVLNFYSDYQNVSYKIQNISTGKELQQVSVRYPQLVIMNGVNEEDSLLITAYSKSDKFEDIQVGTRIDPDLRAGIDLPIKEYGGFDAEYLESENEDNVAILYDSSGNFVNCADYGQDGKLSVRNLHSGIYTIISMGRCNFNHISKLERLQTMLDEGIDYCKNSIEISNGVIKSLSVNNVPKLDIEKILIASIINHNMSFISPETTDAVVGNYVTMVCTAVPTDGWATELSDVEMTVDLPEALKLVKGSVMVGNKKTEYTLEGASLTIPVPTIGQIVKFCVIPVMPGEFNVSAFIKSQIGNVENSVLLGNTVLEVCNAKINVPQMANSDDIVVTGTSVSSADIEVFDNGIMVGKTRAQGNGAWFCNVKLNNSYNLTKHSISAQISGKDYQYTTETVESVYDKYSVCISKVTMYHNGVTIVFDYINPNIKSTTYWQSGSDFTFTIEFTDNDPTHISNVVLYLKTVGGVWIPLDAQYDEQKGLWVAAISNLYDPPVNVAVDYTCDNIVKVDQRLIDESLDFLALSQQEMSKVLEQTDNILQQIENSYDSESPDVEILSSLYSQLYELTGIDFQSDDEPVSELTDEELLLECDNLLNGSDDNLAEGFLMANYDMAELREYMEGMEISDCDGLTEESLLESGYQLIPSTEDGKPLYYYASESLCVIVDFTSNKKITITDKSPLHLDTRHNAISPELETKLKRLKNICDKIKTTVNAIVGYIDHIEKSLHAKNEKLAEEVKELDRRIKVRNDVEGAKRLIEKRNKLCSRIVENAKLAQWVKRTFKQAHVGAGFAKGFAIGDILITALDAYDKYANTIIPLAKKVPEPCENDAVNAHKLSEDINNWAIMCGVYYAGNLLASGVQLGLMSGGLLGAVPTGGTSLGAVGIAFGVALLNMAAAMAFDYHVDINKNKFEQRISELQCQKDTPPSQNVPNENQTNEPPKGQKSGNKDAQVSIDPSGFVFEGVPSNRLQGVVTTAYYKTAREDEYGIIHDIAQVWDASEFSQDNPLLTDENGMYQWYVPQGEWQVKYEKEGYETMYSEWLPVPPPQLEVNIGMKHLNQPQVKQVHAYKSGIEVEFDKYMMLEYLTTENIMLVQNDRLVNGSIVLLNSEASYSNQNIIYVSKVRFVPEEQLTATPITLTISNRVRCYAALPMQDNYQQTFEIEPEISEVIVPETINIACHSSTQITILTLPYEATAGKTLTVVSSTPAICSVENEYFTIDSNGMVEITITGDLPGTAYLNFSMEGYDISATSIVNVQTPVVKASIPTASIATNSVVARGTVVYLESETPDAVIYYTTDGSFPSMYTGTLYTGKGIEINSDITIRCVAYAEGMLPSDLEEFSYSISIETSMPSNIDNNENVRVYPTLTDSYTYIESNSTVKEVALYSVTGEMLYHAEANSNKFVINCKKIPAGAYILTIQTDKQKTMHRIIKR